MFTSKDVECRTIFVINCISERNLRVCSGELLLEEAEESGKPKTLTKMPFQKILALFVIGHISITTPLIEKCKKYGVALVVMKPNLRPIFFWSDSAEANYLLRQKQHKYSKEDISIAKVLVTNKIQNQIIMLENTRKKDTLTVYAIEMCHNSIETIDLIDNYNELLGIEGFAAKYFFDAYYQGMDWKSRKPRSKCDEINATLDIGYTILFNYIECFLRMFGFDVFIGVYHRLWFKRKSLVCDIIEPFRCLIDRAIRTSFNKGQFKKSDYLIIKGEFVLKRECNSYYYKVFYDALIPYKTKIFKYVQSYYRCFMKGALPNQFPKFVP